MSTQILHRTLALSVIGILAITSCRKDAGLPVMTESATDKVSEASVAGESLAAAFSPYQVLGNYSLRGSRTKYRGQANENGDNISVIFDYFGERTLTELRSDKAVTCGYGEPNLTSQGWKYVIRYNPATKQILLSPNDTMAASIKRGSFEVLAAVYAPAYGSFTFQTRYTDKDGNENEVIDILNKE